MRRLRYVLWLGFLAIVLAGYFILRSLGFYGTMAEARAKPVPDGDQEIAFIQAATSGATWERFVAGIRRVQKEWPEEWPKLVIEGLDRDAFPEQSAAVPEVAVSYPGCKGKLRFRWYKLTSDASSRQWVHELAQRQPPPLAIIGGGSSDRAQDLAQALKSESSWHGEPPLLMISTATADTVETVDAQGNPLPKSLMEIYPGSSYRFCFTNSQMAEAIWDFIWTQDDLRPFIRANFLLPSGIAEVLGGDLWGSLPLLVWGSSQRQPSMFQIVDWADDPYSIDLGNQFRGVLEKDPDFARPPTSFRVPYSVGDFLRPNPREAFVIQQMASFMPVLPEERCLLILPATDKPARRFLRNLASAAPQQLAHAVVVTGDSIAFNTLYRDRHLLWNIQDLPVPIVVFCHQNPVAWAETTAENPPTAANPEPSGTDDELLNADIVATLVEAAFGLPQRKAGSTTPTDLVAAVLQSSSQALNADIKRRRADYFRNDGNRKGGSGEYLVCLRPIIQDGLVMPQAVLEVWQRGSTGEDHKFWRRILQRLIHYTDSLPGEAHGAF
jgi:hypothetical protein